MKPTIICTVDVVLLTLKSDKLYVALLKRDREPFEGAWALPGGYIHAQEDKDAEDAAARVLLSKTGIRSPYLEQLATFAGPTRDPRGWSVSIAYYALVPAEVIESAGNPGVRLQPAETVKGLPFDHAEVVRAAVQRLRNKSEYSSLPVYLCGEEFTLPQLQTVYETILGEPINKVSFRRKLLDDMDFIEPTGGVIGGQHRPAKLYRVKPKKVGGLSILERGMRNVERAAA